MGAFAKAYPNAEGALAGRTGLLATIVAEALGLDHLAVPSQPDGRWPTFAGAPSRTKVAPGTLDVGSLQWRIDLVAGPPAGKPPAEFQAGSRQRHGRRERLPRAAPRLPPDRRGGAGGRQRRADGDRVQPESTALGRRARLADVGVAARAQCRADVGREPPDAERGPLHAHGVRRPDLRPTRAAALGHVRDDGDGHGPVRGQLAGRSAEPHCRARPRGGRQGRLEEGRVRDPAASRQGSEPSCLLRGDAGRRRAGRLRGPDRPFGDDVDLRRVPRPGQRGRALGAVYLRGEHDDQLPGRQHAGDQPPAAGARRAVDLLSDEPRCGRCARRRDRRHPLAGDVPVAGPRRLGRGPGAGPQPGGRPRRPRDRRPRRRAVDLRVRRRHGPDGLEDAAAARGQAGAPAGRRQGARGRHRRPGAALST